MAGSAQIVQVELYAVSLALELLAEAHADRGDAAGGVQVVALIAAVAVTAA